MWGWRRKTMPFVFTRQFPLFTVNSRRKGLTSATTVHCWQKHRRPKSFKAWPAGTTHQGSAAPFVVMNCHRPATPILDAGSNCKGFSCVSQQTWRKPCFFPKTTVMKTIDAHFCRTIPKPDRFQIIIIPLFNAPPLSKSLCTSCNAEYQGKAFKLIKCHLSNKSQHCRWKTPNHLQKQLRPVSLKTRLKALCFFSSS